jgi:MoaA/NifB/PqqE/SkfB family radical SAM enzyme
MMNNFIKFDSIWKLTSTQLLDLAMRSRALREWALKQGEKQLFDQFVVRNEDLLPRKAQEMRYLALSNLFHAVDRALADGRISSQVRRTIIKTFVGNVLMGETARMEPFVKRNGFRPPTFLVISPTQQCNLYCKGCYAVSSSRDKATLRYDIFQRVLREKQDDWGSRFTVISGGEPLMYRSQGKDFFDILGENQDTYFMMYTNGTLIDEEAARKMAQLGNITPAISVEGWEKETDARRGPGVFRKVQGAMDRLVAHGVPFGISVTATRENAEIILSEKFLDYYFREKGAIYGWIFQYMPIGRSFTLDLMITPEQRKWMLEKELDMIYRKKLFLVDFWNGGPISVGCIAAGRPGGYFYIDWNGNVAPCAFFPYYLDNVYKIYEEGRDMTSVLSSEYFRAVQAWQNEYALGRKQPDDVHNLLMPCPMRDHHKFAYATVNQFGAKPLDGEAAKAIGDADYHSKLIQYDDRVQELLDPIWERDFHSGTPGLTAPGRLPVERSS